MTAQFFRRVENNNPAKRDTFFHAIEVPADADLTALLAAAYAAGMPRGSFRTGCFEIQTDAGIWFRDDGMALGRNPRKDRFRTWEQLDNDDINHALSA